MQTLLDCGWYTGDLSCMMLCNSRKSANSEEINWGPLSDRIFGGFLKRLKTFSSTGDFIHQNNNWILSEVILQDNDESLGIMSASEGSGNVER